MAAPTNAIWSGFVRSLSRPTAEYASSGVFCSKYWETGKRPVWNGITNGIVGDRHVVVPGGSVGQSPYAWACAASFAAPSFSPTSANVTLHDSRNASAIVTELVPPRHHSFPKFCSVLEVWGNASSCGLGHRLDGENPFSSAADAVMSLKVEPGRNSSSFAREIRGLDGSAFSRAR